MLRLPSTIESDDVRQWLMGGICCVEIDGEQEPAVLRRVLGSSALVSTLSGGFSAETIQVPFTDLYGHWPMCGSVNIPEAEIAIHVERKQARQYRRTFNDRQVAYRVPRMWEVRGRVGNLHVVRTSTPSVVRALFKPQPYPEVERALEMLESGWLSVAVNPRVIIAGDSLGKRLVYYRGRVAASIDAGELVPATDTTTAALIHKALEGRYPLCASVK